MFLQLARTQNLKESSIFQGKAGPLIAGHGSFQRDSQKDGFERKMK